MGRLLPEPYGTTGVIAAAGSGAAISTACLSAIGRGGSRALGGEPALTALLRRGVLSELFPAPLFDAVAVAQVDRSG
jgi:hypothetical protein